MLDGPDASHFYWQIESPIVADRERELVRSAFFPLAGRVLDVGCGHGATLVHLGRPSDAVGIDIDADKIAVARRHLTNVRFEVASAAALPFEAGSFAQVIVRDVIHHLDDPRRVLEECRRVLEPGGRIDVLEPCRNNPLMFMHGLLIREERGELRSTMRYLEALLSPGFDVTERRRYQPLPIHRLVLHPTLGWPAAGRARLVRGLIERVESGAERWMPGWAWAYLHLRAFRRG